MISKKKKKRKKELYTQKIRRYFFCSPFPTPLSKSLALIVASLSHAQSSLPAAALELAIYYREVAADRSDWMSLH